MSGHLSARTVALCGRALSKLGPGYVRADVELIRSHLDEPLRVAVAGRVSAGKSTLINALLGRRVAATHEGECTKIVSVFRYAPVGSAALRFRDGRPPLRLSISSLPTLALKEYGITAAEVEALDVYLDSEWLRELTLLDTPGLASANADASQVTEEALMMDASTRMTVGEADAVVYLFAHDSERQSDVEALDAFRQSAMTAVGVLCKADTAGQGGPEAMETAKVLAERIHGRVRGRVNQVVPVAALLAETVNTRDFDEAELAALQELARSPRDFRPHWQLSDVLALDGEAPAEVRERLYRHLGKVGLLRSLELIEQGLSSNDEIETDLRELSGLDRVRHVLATELLPRADPLKANWAIERLKATAYRSADADNAATLRALLETELDAIVHDPAMHELEEMQALRELLTDSLLPTDLRDAALALLAGRDARTKLELDHDASRAEMTDAVKDAAQRWKSYAAVHTPQRSFDVRSAAQTVERSYTRLWVEIEQGERARSDTRTRQQTASGKAF